MYGSFGGHFASPVWYVGCWVDKRVSVKVNSRFREYSMEPMMREEPSELMTKTLTMGKLRLHNLFCRNLED